MFQEVCSTVHPSYCILLMEKSCTSWDVKSPVNNGKQLPTSTGACRISAINSIALLQCTTQEFGICKLFGLVVSISIFTNFLAQIPNIKNFCQADYLFERVGTTGALFGQMSLVNFPILSMRLAYFYLHENHKKQQHRGKYTSPMDPIGMDSAA